MEGEKVVLPSFREFYPEEELIKLKKELFMSHLLCHSMEDFYQRCGLNPQERFNLATTSWPNQFDNTDFIEKQFPVTNTREKSTNTTITVPGNKKVKTKFERNEFSDFKAGIHYTQLRQKGCKYATFYNIKL
ncbi:hypothetical protein ABK040_013019 [Willaertia magna]